MAILGWIHFEDEPEISQTSLLKSQLPNFNKLEYAPGEEGRYSNLGYVVLAGLIEAVSQQTYQSYIVENILRPLGMERTDFVYTDMMKEDEATGSHPNDIMSAVAPFFIDMNKAVRENRDGKMWFNRLYSNQKGSTGLIGSAKDMGRFMQAVLNEGELDGIRILSAENIQLMQRPLVDVAQSQAPNSDDLSFGLGWFVDQSGGETILSHAGAGMAFVAMMKIYPEKDLGVAVFANSTYLGRKMGDDLASLVAEIDWR